MIEETSPLQSKLQSKLRSKLRSKLSYPPTVVVVVVLPLLLLILSASLPTAAVAADAVRAPANHHERGSSSSFTETQRRQRQRQRQRPPNFVIVLADDLDWTLGGANASTLSKTRRLIGGACDLGGNKNNKKNNNNNGITLSDWFVQTPVCCPSRAELLTGRLYHNLRVPSAGSGGCMHVDVENDHNHPFYKDYYFSNYFAKSTNANTNNSNTNNTNTDTTTNNNRLGLDYKVGIFGKHLNTHNPSSFLPNGVDEMLINGGGQYLNPTFTHGRKSDAMNNTHTDTDIVEEVTFDNCTKTTGMPCYSTSVIGNASLAWIRRQVETNNRDNNNNNNDAHKDNNPFLALISVKAPHIQDSNGFPMATPAPWYKDTLIKERFAPRTPNYNATGINNDNSSDNSHHWLVRNQPPLTELQARKIDDLYVSRLKTLLSVDDLVEDLVGLLETLGALDNTYVVFTSDNGYRLGQFRMPSCKLHPYENDVRVPMMIRGPGIGGNRNGNNARPPRGVTETTTTTGGNQQQPQRALFSHVHLMPTLLGLATGKHDSQDILPSTMDGTNLARQLLDHRTTTVGDHDDENAHDDEFGNNREPSTATTTTSTTTSTTTTNNDVDETSTQPLLSSSESVSLLIEYTSLGDVVRYQHLIDTYNHSFVALRIMPIGSTSTGTSSRSSSSSSGYGSSHTNSTTTNSTTSSTSTSTSSTKIIETISNLKYVEFRDSRVDWTNTETVPLERELYDLDADPYELDNLLAASSPPRITGSLLKALERKTRRLIACSGDDCRNEHSTGLEGPPGKPSSSSSSTHLFGSVAQ